MSTKALRTEFIHEGLLILNPDHEFKLIGVSALIINEFCHLSSPLFEHYCITNKLRLSFSEIWHNSTRSGYAGERGWLRSLRWVNRDKEGSIPDSSSQNYQYAKCKPFFLKQRFQQILQIDFNRISPNRMEQLLDGCEMEIIKFELSREHYNQELSWLLLLVEKNPFQCVFFYSTNAESE